ncbi:hypothetical protein D3C73_593230 [compost metagenome]
MHRLLPTAQDVRLGILGDGLYPSPQDFVSNVLGDDIMAFPRDFVIAIPGEEGVHACVISAGYLAGNMLIFCAVRIDAPLSLNG